VVAVTTVSRSGADAQPRICSNDELAEYALLVAVGPAKPPRCEPATGQILFAPVWQTPSNGAEKPVKSGLATFSSQVRLHMPVKGGAQFIHLRVVQSDSAWCPPPCDAPSWELAAPKPEKGSNYVLLEAAIWRQYRNVTLYQFDAEWEKLARNSHHGLCDGKDWGCPAYKKHREEKALVTKDTSGNLGSEVASVLDFSLCTWLPPHTSPATLYDMDGLLVSPAKVDTR